MQRPWGHAQVPGHRAARRRPDQRVLDRALLPEQRLHDRHGVGEAHQLLRLAVRAQPAGRPAQRPARHPVPARAGRGGRAHGLRLPPPRARSSGWSWPCVAGDRPSCTCPRAACGTPGCCPSTTWPSTWSGRSGIAEVGRTVARIIASDVRRPPRVVLWITAWRRARRLAASCWACPCTRCPSAPSTTDGSPTSGDRSRPRTRASSPAGPTGTSPATRARRRYPEYYAVVQTMAKIGKRAGLRARHVGVLRLAQQLRHADGADAAAVLDQRLHRIDGGPLLRGLGHHAVPLPQPERAVDLAVRRRCAGLPYRATALTQSDFDLGVAHLQMLGVRYYMASTRQTIGYAAEQPRR